MFVDTPQNTMYIANLKDGITDDGTHYVLRMRRDASLFFLKNKDAKPSKEQYKEFREYVEEITGLLFNQEQAEAILSLFPRVRIKLSLYGIGPTDVRGDISDAVAQFFLGCTWPTYGDEIDSEAFLNLLQNQARLFGNEVSSQGRISGRGAT